MYKLNKIIFCVSQLLHFIKHLTKFLRFMSTLRKIWILSIINWKIVRLHQCVNQVMPRNGVMSTLFCVIFVADQHEPKKPMFSLFDVTVSDFFLKFNWIIKQNIRARLPVNNRDLKIRGRRRQRKRR